MVPRKALRALVVDDNSTQRYVLTRLVEQAGYEFAEAMSAEDAIEYLQREIPDVIISDIRLPKLDGFELCRRVKAYNKASHVPVVLVTSMYYNSNREEEDTAKGKKKAKDVGAYDLFPRGESLEKLPLLLRELARKG